MSGVETRKLPTLKHLHLKGEHIYISLILKKKKKIKSKHVWLKYNQETTKTPPQIKKVRRVQFPIFPFRNLATKCDLFCCSRWY